MHWMLALVPGRGKVREETYEDGDSKAVGR